MTVQSILATKGKDVTTGDPSMTIAQVCARLAEHRIGALVMTDESRSVVGIISERDVVRVMANGGADALQDTASRHMTRTVITCGKRDSVDDVMEKMTRGRFRHVPVCDNGELVGIISIGDVVKYRMAEIEREAQDMRSYIATA
ncbi:CBS domain-containing protein [Chthonobacter rhizosphaerae]|uniref:CBS domain-containing protein n=1 Tax=Chthonobacter rhizosphaerae TaxID=2735553 RepID=UPI0015EFD764|nr:CBS domain-containing protein [Chthonobacter rhizosphaerae]